MFHISMSKCLAVFWREAKSHRLMGVFAKWGGGGGGPYTMSLFESSPTPLASPLCRHLVMPS